MSSNFAKILHRGDFASQTLGSHSGFANFINPAGRVLTNVAEGKGLTTRSLLDPAGVVLKNPNDIKAPPAPPTIDEARQNIDEADRLRKRRGLYANIFAGNASAPLVGKATLGG